MTNESLLSEVRVQVFTWILYFILKYILTGKVSETLK